MDEIMRTRFQQMDNAVDFLIESITAYNPSIMAAEALLRAEDEFSEGVELLAQHQENHARITNLRSIADSLDEQIKATITMLADVRRELIDLPISATAIRETSDPTIVGSGGRVETKKVRDVPYKELLLFAKNISPFTVPPSGLVRQHEEAASQAEKAGEPQPQDGSAEPAAAPAANDVDESQTQVDPSQLTQSTLVASSASAPPLSYLKDPKLLDGYGPAADVALGPGMKAWMDSLANEAFVPWPNEQKLREGALAHIMRLVESGTDPGAVPLEGVDGVPVPGTGGGAAAQQQQVKDEDVKMEDEEPSRGVDGTTAAAAANGTGSREETLVPQSAVERPRAPASFEGFGLYDPDDDV